MINGSMIYPLFLCLMVTLVGLLLLTKGPFSRLAMDKPNERSLHQRLTPRTGGLALMLGVLVAWLFLGCPIYWIMLPAGLMMTSLMDDIRGLPITLRFGVQVLICMIFLLCLLHEFAWWQYVVLTLSMVWVVNLYNFMDGSDGLAGGMTMFGFGAYAVAAYLGGQSALAVMTSMVTLASIVFLAFNFHPARIFMGDVGSIPLGFLAGALGIYGWISSLWPLWFPALVFSPFFVDASVTLFRRLITGEKVWQAHRSHYYQRLVQMGWGHRKTAIVEYVLMLAVAISALGLLNQPAKVLLPVLLGWMLLYIMILLKIDKSWAAYKKGS